MNLVFLDACRDNPFARSFRSSSRGLGRENAPSGTLISFATRPGSTAADGDGRNGLYTSVLLQQIKNTDQPIEQVLKRVVTGVKSASKGQQEPWMEGSIEGDFCFGQCFEYLTSNTTTNFKVEEKKDPEVEAWNAATRINSPLAYQEYLNAYPSGKFKSAAQISIISINKNNSTTQNSFTDIQQVLYEIKPGDTLLRISVNVGQSWRDIARWNNISNPNNIPPVGQFLKVSPPPLENEKPIPSNASQTSTNNDFPLQTTTDLRFMWPAKGRVISYYDADKNKGLDISGALGDAVIASSSGKVVYSGAGLKGYGNLIIIKHDDKHLTSYSHNRILFVKENQLVTAGEKIAEMGDTDSKEVKLHFEIRVNGKPVDPLPYIGSQVQ